MRSCSSTVRCDVFPSRKLSSHEKRVQFFSCQPQTAGQLHLVVIKETFARVIASRRKRPQCRGINICGRAHLGSALRRLAVLSCRTCGGKTQEPSPRSDLTTGIMEG
ncbi:hypothetical protein AVEN_20424-1 [Araneus ventricosus]|uniref:Uncharacterized protein n=1 Tax=Araneus ventricosus TaxID=182803 RepID=A0A4Y2K7M7_ARAVE|nr:hypothetical protein AVEN_20424-1 [Araneus ventricosus]